MKKKNVQAMLTGMAVMMSVMLPTTSVLAAVPEKEQTVYVNADENGKSENVIVSNWLKNIDGDTQLTDKSELNNIQNVKGDEGFKQGSDSSLTWDANGKDIYYQGETTKELPVGVNLTYYLDGKEIQPSDLAGKSGKVKIRIDYENKQQETAEVNGNEEEIYTPFMMMTAMILPTDVFTNIEIENGKVLSDGNNTIAVGFGFPGLSDSLQLSETEELKDLEIPDFVEITADVKDFELSMTATVATTGLLDELNLGEIDSADELKENMNKLTESSTALVKGSKELQDGISKLNSSADTFVNGLNSADNGAGQLKNGIDKMNSSKGELLSGISRLTQGMEALENGASQLQTGVGSYTAGSAKLGEGIAKTAEGASTLKGGIDTLNEKKEALVQGIGNLSTGSKDLKDGAQTLKEGVSAYTAGVDKVDKGLGLLNSQIQGALGQTEQLPEAIKGITEGSKALINGAGQLQEGAKQAEAAAGNMEASVGALAQAAGGVAQGAGGAAGIIENYIGSLNDNGSAAATEQAKAAIAKENAAVNAQANAQQRANVAAALSAAGLTEEQQQAVLANLGNISVGVQTSANIEVPANTGNTEAVGQLKNIQAQMAAVQQQIAGTDLGAVQEQIGQLKTGAQTAVAGAEELTKGVTTFGEAVKPLGGFSTMASTLKDAVAALKAGSGELCKQNSALNTGASQVAVGSQKMQGGLEALSEGATQLSAGIEQLTNGAASLADGTAQLQSGSQELNQNNEQLNAGAAQLAAGSQELSKGGNTLSQGAGVLSNGIAQLASGAASLKDGTSKLASGGKELKSGVTQLQDGSVKLADGMAEFDKEGIQKLSDVLNGELQTVLDRLKAVEDADKAYTAFDGASQDMNGKVKFIIETAGIEKE